MKAQIAAKYIQFLSNKKANKNSGFTLIELLVVIIIIGILSAIALPSFLNQAAKARASEARTNVGAVNRAQQAYYLENQVFVAGTGVPAALGLGTQNTTNYTYSSTLGGTTGVFNNGTPATGKTDLKAYVGAVLRTNNATTISNLCETLNASITAAANPALDPAANSNAGSITCDAATTKPLN